MRSLIWCGIVLAVVAISGNVSADPAAAKLLNLCNEGKGRQGYLLCSAYIAGVEQGIWAAQQFYKDGGKTCAPLLSDEEAIAVVMKYMNTRRDLLNSPMLAITSAAFLAEYECK
jgi:hypothetical protein